MIRQYERPIVATVATIFLILTTLFLWRDSPAKASLIALADVALVGLVYLKPRYLVLWVIAFVFVQGIISGGEYFPNVEIAILAKLFVSLVVGINLLIALYALRARKPFIVLGLFLITIVVFAATMYILGAESLVR